MKQYLSSMIARFIRLCRGNTREQRVLIVRPMGAEGVDPPWPVNGVCRATRISATKDEPTFIWLPPGYGKSETILRDFLRPQ